MTEPLEALAFDYDHARATYDSVRRIAQVMTVAEAQALARKVLGDAGFPMADEAWVEYNPWEESAHGRVGWDLNEGITPPIPGMLLGPTGMNEFTVLHECAHILRNGPEMAGTRYRGTDLEADGGHDQRWWDTLTRLVGMYGTTLFASAFDHLVLPDVEPGLRRVAGAWGPLPEGLTFEVSVSEHANAASVVALHPDAPVGMYGDNRAGHITWDLGLEEIDFVKVIPQFRRRGLATELLRRAREVTPGLRHSEILSADGTAWSRKVAGPGTYQRVGSMTDAEETEQERHERSRDMFFLANGEDGEDLGQVDGIVYEFQGWATTPWGTKAGRITAYQGLSTVGSIEWIDGVISSVWVAKGYRRQGIATRLLEHARALTPGGVQHSTLLTDDGRAWMTAVGSAGWLYDGEREVGFLSWDVIDPSRFDTVSVRPDYRRRGIATHLWEEAKKANPDLDPDSSVFYTPDGKAFVDSLTRTAGPASDMVPLERFPVRTPSRGTSVPRDVKVLRMAEKDIARLHPGQAKKVEEVLVALREGRAEVEPKERPPLLGSYTVRVTNSLRLGLYLSDDQPGGDDHRDWVVVWVGDHTYEEYERRMQFNPGVQGSRGGTRVVQQALPAVESARRPEQDDHSGREVSEEGHSSGGSGVLGLERNYARRGVRGVHGGQAENPRSPILVSALRGSDSSGDGRGPSVQESGVREPFPFADGHPESEPTEPLRSQEGQHVRSSRSDLGQGELEVAGSGLPSGQGSQDSQVRAAGGRGAGSAGLASEVAHSQRVGSNLTHNYEEAERRMQRNAAQRKEAADYWMNHRPQRPGVGVPSLDACATAFGYDEGDEDAFYRSGVDSFAPSADYSAEAITQVRAARGKPDLLVDIYRAVPPGVDRFAQGDWVTLSRAYAGEHLREILGGNGTVLHARVPARQVFPSGEWDVLEWGYWGVGARSASLEVTADADVSYRVVYRDALLSDGEAMVVATVDGWDIGALRWDYWSDPPVIVDVSVEEEYRRQGIATEMLRRAREIEPNLQHSDHLTADGRVWRAAVGGLNGLVYRGFPLTVDDEQHARALLAGGQVATDVLLTLISESSLGVWWTSEAGEVYSHAQAVSGDYDLSIKGAVEAADRGEGFYGAETSVVLAAAVPTAWEQEDWQVPKGSPIDLVSIKYTIDPMDDTAWRTVPVGRTLAASTSGAIPAEVEWKVAVMPEHLHSQGIGGTVYAFLEGANDEELRWPFLKDCIGILRWFPGGEISDVWTHEDYRRRGMATELLRRAREADPTVHHSETLTNDGRAWSQKVGSRPIEVHRGVNVEVDFGDEYPEEVVRAGRLGEYVLKALRGQVGVHWTVSRAVAEDFSDPMSRYAEPKRTRNANWALSVPVVISATVDATAIQTDGEVLDDLMVQNYGWQGLNPDRHEEEITLKPGAAVNVTSIQAALPTDPEALAADLETMNETGHVPSAWTEIAGPRQVTARNLGLRATWHRGMQIMLDVKDPRAIALLEALASGATTVARDRLIELMAGGSGYDPWTGNRNGPREGAGGWWTTDTSAAWTYASGIPTAGEEDDAIHASVILHAEISDEYEADFDGSGYGWHHLDPGTPLTITGVTATLPIQQQARLLVDLARSQGMWFDPMGMGGDDFVYPGLSERWEIEERIYEWSLTMRTQASLGSSQTYFHGTSVALGTGTVIAPREPGAWEPGQPTRSPGERFSDPAVAYATTEESDAWHWAEHAWNAGRGDLPRVYRVRPLGEVHPDPNNEFAGDVVSPDGFEVVEEVTSGSDYDFWREGSLGKTAMADLMLNRDVFYRVHHLQRAFSVEDAWSAPLRISFDDEMDEPREGYSCYPTPWELWAYVALQSWTAGTARDEILIFSGDVVGEGIDGEPLVVPDHRVEQFISWRAFLDALAQHTGKFPEGGFVGGIGTMPWLLVAHEALQEDPNDPVAQRLMADAFRGQDMNPQMAGGMLQMLFANRRTATHDVQGDLYLISDVPDAMDLVLDLSDASSEEVVVRLGESLDNVVMQFPSLDPVVTSVWRDGKFVSATARGWGYITDLAVLRERLALAPRG